MKVSTGKLFMLLTVTLTMLTAPAAWAQLQSLEGPYLVEGTVAYTLAGSLAVECGYTIDPDLDAGCPLTISGMGPAGWWSANEVAFPVEGAAVAIRVYKATCSGDVKYVAAEVVDNGEGDSLVLRTPEVRDGVLVLLNPVWSRMEPVAEATALLTSSGEDTDCTCKCSCTGDACDCDCVCDSADCGEDCVPVGDENKWKGQK